MTMTPEKVRAARAYLGIRQKEVAKETGLVEVLKK